MSGLFGGVLLLLIALFFLVFSSAVCADWRNELAELR
jgi:hypothetical protein